MSHFTLCLCSILLFAYIPSAPAAPLHRPILPIQPGDLIKFLPAAPQGWETKESKAKSFYNEWLVAQANRLFVGPVPQNSVIKGVAAPPAPPTTRFRLTDTGYTPALQGDFDQFTPGRYGAAESFMFGAFPARRTNFPGGERLQILIKARFVVEVEVHNQLPNAVLTWAKQVDLARIAAAPESGTEILPNPVTVVSLDELNPKSNSSYQVSWSTQADLDAARQRSR